jgi:hypothetical protein
MLDKIIVWFPEDQFLKADGFDEAIIGIEVSTNRLIYSVSKCIKILSEQMEEEEAVEYFEYNVVGCYVGELTPIFCQDNF